MAAAGGGDLPLPIISVLKTDQVAYTCKWSYCSCNHNHLRLAGHVSGSSQVGLEIEEVAPIGTFRVGPRARHVYEVEGRAGGG